MSADNYYIIRKHPDGGFAALMGFASDDRMPVIDTDRAYKTFETVDQAVMWASDEYSEYGVSVHPECREYPVEKSPSTPPPTWRPSPTGPAPTSNRDTDHA